MTENSHPVFERLLNYHRDPLNVDFSDIRIHIVGCDKCKQDLDKIHSLNTLDLSENSQLPDEMDILPIEKIAAYINKQLDDKEIKNIENLIQEDQNIKAATLHYALHSQSMRDAGVFLATEKVKKKENNQEQIKNQFIEKIMQLFDWQTPAWVALPIVAVLLIVITFQNQSPEKQQPTIAVYQDEAIITYRDTIAEAPGIGFFNESRINKKTFKGIETKWKDTGKLEISWQNIPQAQHYSFILYRVSVSGLEEIASKSVNQPLVYLTNLHLENNKRYQWKISGPTHSNTRFETQGGLVVKF